MSNGDMISALDISASALSAQLRRMGVIASNVANANSLETPDGGPYKKREITFATVMQSELGDSVDSGVRIGGVRVASVKESTDALKTVYDPNHPNADEKGFVRMPNVNVTEEMVEMISAQRAYEANLSAMKAYRDMLRSSLLILKR